MNGIKATDKLNENKSKSKVLFYLFMMMRIMSRECLDKEMISPYEKQDES